MTKHITLSLLAVLVVTPSTSYTASLSDLPVSVKIGAGVGLVALGVLSWKVHTLQQEATTETSNNFYLSSALAFELGKNKTFHSHETRSQYPKQVTQLFKTIEQKFSVGYVSNYSPNVSKGIEILTENLKAENLKGHKKDPDKFRSLVQCIQCGFFSTTLESEKQ